MSTWTWSVYKAEGIEPSLLADSKKHRNFLCTHSESFTSKHTTSYSQVRCCVYTTHLSQYQWLCEFSSLSRFDTPKQAYKRDTCKLVRADMYPNCLDNSWLYTPPSALWCLWYVLSWRSGFVMRLALWGLVTPHREFEFSQTPNSNSKASHVSDPLFPSHWETESHQLTVVV